MDCHYSPSNRFYLYTISSDLQIEIWKLMNKRGGNYYTDFSNISLKSKLSDALQNEESGKHFTIILEWFNRIPTDEIKN